MGPLRAHPGAPSPRVEEVARPRNKSAPIWSAADRARASPPPPTTAGTPLERNQPPVHSSIPSPGCGLGGADGWPVFSVFLFWLGAPHPTPPYPPPIRQHGRYNGGPIPRRGSPPRACYPRGWARLGGPRFFRADHPFLSPPPPLGSFFLSPPPSPPPSSSPAFLSLPRRRARRGAAASPPGRRRRGGRRHGRRRR